jgi:hypothetical protein
VLKTGVIRNKNLIEINVTSKCWVCEGWNNIEFRLNKSEVEAALNLQINQDQKHSHKIYVNLHMSFDGYRPHLMDEIVESGGNVFQLFRMVPPGSLYYFYSIGNITNMKPEQHHKMKTLTDGYNPIILNEHETVIVPDITEIPVPKFNYIDGDIELF